MKKLLFCSFVLLLLIGSIKAQDFSITIDAERDAFYDQLVNPLDGKIFLPSKAYLRDIGTPATLTGDDDLSGIIWSCWDENYLYYYAEITDDAIFNDNATSSGSQWQNDKIEQKIDPDPIIEGTADVIQVGISAFGEDYAQAIGAVDNLSQDSDMRDIDGVVWVSTPEDYARKEVSNGYVLEWRLPFQYLNKNSRIFPAPAEGVVFGEAINLTDNDSGQRDNMLQWSAGFADGAWNNAQKHGKVTLLADHKLKYEAVCAHTEVTVVNDSEYVWYFGGTSVSVGPEQISKIPKSFTLSQNFPNPFNPNTIIRYSLNETDNVSLNIYDINGQMVRSLISNLIQNPGTYQINWNAKDEKGTAVTSGVYYYQIKHGSSVITKKMILLR
jgi:hypothetical protein